MKGWLAVLLPLIACDAAERPELCVVDARTMDSRVTTCPSTQLAALEPRAAIYVMHVLPRGVTAARATLRVETPCAAVEREVEYGPSGEEDRLAAFALFATPEGGECGAIVTATTGAQTYRRILGGNCATACAPADASREAATDGASEVLLDDVDVGATDGDALDGVGG